MEEKYAKKKIDLAKKGYAYLEDSTCFFRGENFFGASYIEKFSQELLQAIGLLHEVHANDIVANLILAHIVEATLQGKDHKMITLDILNQTLSSEDSINIDREDAVGIALQKLHL